MKLHLDFETACDLDLRTVGRARYMAHRSFRVILTAAAIGDGEVHQWEGFPSLDWGSFEIHAFNAPFERAVLRRYGVDIPLDQWRCTMAHAYSRGFSGGLANVGSQIGLPLDQAKLADGSRLVTKFCSPRRLSKDNHAPYWTAQTKADDWERFRLYNRQDVVAEREVTRRLASWPMDRAELELMWWDWQVNDRGLPVDLALVDNAILAAKVLADLSNDEVKIWTGGISGTQVAKLLEWCRETGAPWLESLAADDVKSALDRPDLPPAVSQVLQLRLDVAQSATKKFDKIRAIAHQGRIYDTLQFYGAQRTGRWAGRNFQSHNLKRTQKDAEAMADQLVTDPKGFLAERDLKAVGGLIRTAITASPGHSLVVSDLSAIESRVLGWLTGCRWINQVFADGKDTYKAFAEMWLRVPYDQVDKATRTLCKPPFLGFGYGIGAVGLETYAHAMGIAMTADQCASAIKTARSVCHEVPAFWKEVESAFRYTTSTGHSSKVSQDRITLRMEGRFLTIELPVGRKLYYDSPEVSGIDGSCSFMGQNQYTNQWERGTTWGGKLVENQAQAIARDVLAHGLLTYSKGGGTIIGHVHDEAIAEECTEHAQTALAYMNQCLSTTPSWLPGIVLGAEGYIAKRYRKD